VLKELEYREKQLLKTVLNVLLPESLTQRNNPPQDFYNKHFFIAEQSAYFGAIIYNYLWKHQKQELQTEGLLILISIGSISWATLYKIFELEKGTKEWLEKTIRSRYFSKDEAIKIQEIFECINYVYDAQSFIRHPTASNAKAFDWIFKNKQKESFDKLIKGAHYIHYFLDLIEYRFSADSGWEVDIERREQMILTAQK